tara:strand:+ start:441 stop:965 length:525 start_codon:yes stop_codon:yes gene_type:complete
MSVFWEFDYTLEIDFEILSDRDLQGILQLLYGGSTECYKDIELLADEVIRRLDECQYAIREKENRRLAQLIVSTFETLKKILPFRSSSGDKIQIIHDNYKKYMFGDLSPVVSPVTSPKVDREPIKVPKIMKKVKKGENGASGAVPTPPPNEEGVPGGGSGGIKFQKIMSKFKSG